GVALAIAGDALWYQHRAEASLRSQEAAPQSVESTVREVSVAAGTPLARLAVPRLGTSVVVAEGVDETVLRRAAGRLPESARFDEDGNVAVAGHRDTFFRSLERIRAGDRVVIERAGGRSEYEVEWAAVVEPSRIEVTHDAGYPALTLVTCFPFTYVGEAPYRYVVRARRVGAAAPARGASS
ncbi:MAG: class D sortase, partial [Thermoanaerobaculia bacterium]|nr:class D sortase [Thermoanaerobaculia bacterium]